MRACVAFNVIYTHVYKVTFQNNTLSKWTHDKRSVGRPRANWTYETIKETWDHIKKDIAGHRFTPFDGQDEEIINHIKQYAETHDERARRRKPGEHKPR